MRRNLFLYPFAVSAAAVAVLAASAAIVIAPVGAAPGKTHKPPAAAALKRPKLAGQTVINDDIDMRFVVPDGWAASPDTAQSVGKYARTPMYFYVNSTDNVEMKAHITYYNPPQFHIGVTDLTGTVDANQITTEQQDELTKAIIKNTNKSVLNFRYEGSRHILVDGEPATAFAAVATAQMTQEVVRVRIVSLFRNKHIYTFVFAAPVDDFPRFDALFAKTLENCHFLTPRKKNQTPPAPIVPTNAPAKSPGSI